MDVGAVSIRRDPQKIHNVAHKVNLLGMKNSLMRLKHLAAVYLPGDFELEFE